MQTAIEHQQLTRFDSRFSAVVSPGEHLEYANDDEFQKPFELDHPSTAYNETSLSSMLTDSFNNPHTHEGPKNVNMSLSKPRRKVAQIL
jgi:hypothetical protein